MTSNNSEGLSKLQSSQWGQLRSVVRNHHSPSFPSILFTFLQVLILRALLSKLPARKSLCRILPLNVHLLRKGSAQPSGLLDIGSELTLIPRHLHTLPPLKTFESSGHHTKHLISTLYWWHHLNQIGKAGSDKYVEGVCKTHTLQRMRRLGACYILRGLVVRDMSVHIL